MMHRSLLLLAILVPLCVMSCATLTTVPSGRVSTIDREENLAAVNGDYQVFSKDTSYISLIEVLDYGLEYMRR